MLVAAALGVVAAVVDVPVAPVEGVDVFDPVAGMLGPLVVQAAIAMAARVKNVKMILNFFIVSYSPISNKTY